MTALSGHVNGGVSPQLADLHKPNPRIFWLDLSATAALSWTAFVIASAGSTSLWMRCLFTLLAAVGFYRGLCFLHEIVHVRRAVLPGFETAWNLLFGIALCVPSVMYVGVHQNHHKLSTYGTPEDPEYLPFAGKPAFILFFVFEGLFLPLLLLIRFLVLSWLGLLIPRFHRLLTSRATALTMNPRYTRPVTAALMRTVTIQECMVLAGWGAAFVLAYAGIIPPRAFLVWYATAATLSVTNSLRTLAAHRYRSGGEPLGREEQLRDSVDIPGGVWTELWAPVGLRFHAVHHYYPGIPYHNLGAAYRQCASLSGFPNYRQSTEKSLITSLRSLTSSK